jgi:uncharacterized protein (DUF2252 family)
VSDPPLIVRLEDLLGGADLEEVQGELEGVLRGYVGTLPRHQAHLIEQFRLVDVAHKVVGVGSVGTRCWIALLLGRRMSDPLFLQFKEAGPSVLESLLPRSRYRNCGHRVVAGQRLMQAAGDPFLGYHRVVEPDGVARDYYVRQLRDWKGSVDLERATARSAREYGRLCGLTLARAHARSGDRSAIAAYLGKGSAFDRAMTSFAEAYADRNERDYAALQAAARAGRIEAAEGS